MVNSSTTLLINKSSKLYYKKHNLIIIKDNIKDKRNIFISFLGEEVIIMGDIETSGSITVEASTVRFEGKIKHDKGLTIYGLNIPPVTETMIFIR